MKTKMMVGVLGAVMVAAACGDVSLRSAAEDEAPQAQSQVHAQAASALSLDVRVKATNAEVYRSLLLRPVSIEAVATDSGLPLASEVWGEFFDLATPNHASKIGTVQVPEGVTHVTVKVMLGDWGVFENEATGEIDTRNVSLMLEVPVEFAVNDKVVANIDLSRSLIEKHAGKLGLVPIYRTQF